MENASYFTVEIAFLFRDRDRTVTVFSNVVPISFPLCPGMGTEQKRYLHCCSDFLRTYTRAHHKNQRFVESTKFPTIIKTRYMDPVWWGIYFYIKIIYQTIVFRIVGIWFKFQRPDFTFLIFVGNFQRKKNLWIWILTLKK